jgi:hypothetical protein
MIKKERLPIIFLAMLCLLCGIWSGLNRIGWNMPMSLIASHHGAIMIGGFLGTLISLEKVIPLKKKLLYLIPAFNASSVGFFFFGEANVAIYVLVTSSIGLCIVFLYYLIKQRTIIYTLMLLGATCWVIGNILLLTKHFYPLAFPWWTAFALFIIAAERLELMKFLPVSRLKKQIFVSLLIAFIVGVLFSFHGFGNVICGLALSAVAIWLMKHDLIGINLKKKNLPKFVAISLLSGYVALLLSGIFLLALTDQWLAYDAVVHSFFIGFVFSMIFAHGPIILPGVMGISVSSYHQVLYYWLGMLQISWLIRVFADVAVELDLRKISGLLSATAVLGYFITMAVLTIKRQRNAGLF